MESTEIVYKIKTAAEPELLTHLTKCKNNFIPALDQTVDIAQYSKKIAENAVSFEAWTGNELIGMIAAYFNDAENKKGFITNVSVLKEYAGKGIAAKLMTNCIVFAKEKKFSAIVLEVNNTNRPAIKLYNRFNFNNTTFKGDLNIMTLNLLD